jgi:hypothetical protein
MVALLSPRPVRTHWAVATMVPPVLLPAEGEDRW